jgi:hypothetical protein
MKKTTTKTTRKKTAKALPKDDLRPNYRFDYSQAKPNRFAQSASGPVVAVQLDPDVSAVFKTAASVNKALRRIVETMAELRQ